MLPNKRGFQIIGTEVEQIQEEGEDLQLLLRLVYHFSGEPDEDRALDFILTKQEALVLRDSIAKALRPKA